MEKDLELISKKDRERDIILSVYKKEFLPLIKKGEARPTRVYEYLAKKYGWSRVGVYGLVKRAGLHFSRMQAAN